MQEVICGFDWFWFDWFDLVLSFDLMIYSICSLLIRHYFKTTTLILYSPLCLKEFLKNVCSVVSPLSGVCFKVKLIQMPWPRVSQQNIAQSIAFLPLAFLFPITHPSFTFSTNVQKINVIHLPRPPSTTAQ